ncbi:MAG TPA: ArsA family ATPase [Gemmatimonadaceae bacterium]|nr:ArsA family ATPase [Gemmatimonadaceae bacterium]
MNGFDALLPRLPRTTLVVGKGGVGKTTCAVRIARDFASHDERTLILSTDPAAALADVLGTPVGSAVVSVSETLDARQLDASTSRMEFLAKWRDVIAEIIDRGTYLERTDVDGLVDAALPGADEIFALLALADVFTAPATAYDRVVVDTAPTGHTLRLLALPETFEALVAMLDRMQDKHRFMVRALTHRYRRDRADEFIVEMRQRVARLRATLADGEALAAVLVVRPEAVVEAESRRYLDSLRGLGVRVSGIIVNAVPVGVTTPMIDRSIPHFAIPAWSTAAAGRFTAATEGMPDTRTLTIVGGKGGVGKSTVSCALALAAAGQRSGDILLVSTDPAPSLADAFGAADAAWALTDVEHRLPEADCLVVRQMDASAAFARVRDEYQSRIDELFAAIVGRGVDVSQDRAILRDLLSLAPPGIDELFALSLLGDSLDEGRFSRIIVDPAPTGHLLRLLDMPAIALDWTHRLMRLLLKYRDVVHLGETAQELIDFSKRTRALDALLHDPARCGLILVALDEPIVRAETTRLAAAAKARGLGLDAIVWNRATGTPAPLPHEPAPRQFVAREVHPPPIGVTAIREWSHTWRTLSVSANS